MSTSASIPLYPCDRGMGTPMGFHHFQANQYGVAVCIYCGALPRG